MYGGSPSIEWANVLYKWLHTSWKFCYFSLDLLIRSISFRDPFWCFNFNPVNAILYATVIQIWCVLSFTFIHMCWELKNDAMQQRLAIEWPSQKHVITVISSHLSLSRPTRISIFAIGIDKWLTTHGIALYLYRVIPTFGKHLAERKRIELDREKYSEGWL